MRMFCNEHYRIYIQNCCKCNYIHIHISIWFWKSQTFRFTINDISIVLIYRCFLKLLFVESNGLKWKIYAHDISIIHKFPACMHLVYFGKLRQNYPFTWCSVKIYNRKSFKSDYVIRSHITVWRMYLQSER